MHNARDSKLVIPILIHETRRCLIWSKYYITSNACDTGRALFLFARITLEIFGRLLSSLSVAFVHGGPLWHPPDPPPPSVACATTRAGLQVRMVTGLVCSTGTRTTCNNDIRSQAMKWQGMISLLMPYDVMYLNRIVVYVAYLRHIWFAKSACSC